MKKKPKKKPEAWCPQCGPGGEPDEDWCCRACGADCISHKRTLAILRRHDRTEKRNAVYLIETQWPNESIWRPLPTTADHSTIEPEFEMGEFRRNAPSAGFRVTKYESTRR